MKYRLTAITPKGQMQDGAYVCSLVLDGYIGMFRDITLNSGLSDPNIDTWLVECDETNMNSIEADPKYFVLSSEEIIDETI